MSTLDASLVAVLVLGAAGALPVVALVGCRWPAVPMAPLAGAVLAAAAGGCCLVVAGTTLAWFAGLSSLAALGSAAAIAARRRRTRPARPPTPDRHRLPRADRAAGAAGAAGFVVVLVAVAWGLRLLRVPSTGFDAQDIWLLRASWFAAGHARVLADFRNRTLVIAQAPYPPLVSATVATAWQVTGLHTDRLGVVVVAVLNACAVAAAALAVVEAGRVASRTSRAGRAVPLVTGVVAAGLFVLATYGVLGPFSANGYADPLWAAAAAGAIGFGLLLPWERGNVSAAAILLAVAGLTKDEGTATAVAIVGLLVARAVLGRWREGSRRPLASRLRAAARPVLAGIAGVVGLGAWSVVVRVVHTAPTGNTDGRLVGTYASRARLTVHWMAPHLHVLLLAAPLALAAGLLLAGVRRRAGLGNDLWLWLGLLAGLAAVGLAYVTGPGDTEVRLLTSVHRTTMFPAVAAWLIVAAWVVVASCGVPRGGRAGP